MPRPVTLPTCRLPYAGLPGNAVTFYRRTDAGAYGPVTRDAEGRKAVSIEAVEKYHGIRLSDAQIAAAFETPSKHVTRERKKRERRRTDQSAVLQKLGERLTQLRPVYLTPYADPFNGCTRIDKSDAQLLLRAEINRRDEQWTRLLLDLLYSIT